VISPRDSGKEIVKAAVVERLPQVLKEHVRTDRLGIEEVKALPVAHNLLKRL
jgi:hypothetical protein